MIAMNNLVRHRFHAVASLAWRNLRQTGGFTVHPETGRIPRSGFAVSLRGAEKRLQASACDVTEIAEYFANRPKLEYQTTYVGGWYDLGLIYLDTTIVVPTLETALHVGADNLQLAIYDLASQQNIRIADHLVRAVSPTSDSELSEYHIRLEFWRDCWSDDNRLQSAIIRSPLRDSQGYFDNVERKRIDISGNDASFFNSFDGRLLLADNRWLSHAIAHAEHENRRFEIVNA